MTRSSRRPYLLRDIDMESDSFRQVGGIGVHLLRPRQTTDRRRPCHESQIGDRLGLQRG